MRFKPVFSCSIAAAVLHYAPDNGYIQEKPTTPEERAAEAINRFMVKNGVPGLSIGVTVNGRKWWSNGFGYSDVEQGVKCSSNTVMRIASISKSITATIAARMMQEGKLCIDEPITKYLSDLPKMSFNGESEAITSRQLLCHRGGIRHYTVKNTDQVVDKQVDDIKKDEDREFLSNKNYKTVTEALEMFIHDPLIAKPGTKLNYTTHGYTLLSAVLEKAADKKLPKLYEQLFLELGMNNTCLDVNDRIIPHRTRYYRRTKNHRLENCPEVDNSYKWAGGGILSNVHDLLKFANAMLYSFQSTDHSSPPPYLKTETLQTFWKGEDQLGPGEKEYGLGWGKCNHTERYGGLEKSELAVRSGFWCHSGGAVGTTSFLLLKPTEAQCEENKPNGICVAVLVNVQGCGEISQIALEVAEIFSEC